MITFQKATQDQVPDYPKSTRAITFLQDGKVVGIAGVYLDGTRLVMHSDIQPQVWQHKRTIVQAWRALIGMVKTKGLPIHARPDPAFEASERFMRHIGFKPLTTEIYQWEGT